jgi:hypothetical protein
MTDWYEDRVKELERELGVGTHFRGESLGCGYCRHERAAWLAGRCERYHTLGGAACVEFYGPDEVVFNPRKEV